jgi:hypothetical protein
MDRRSFLLMVVPLLVSCTTSGPGIASGEIAPTLAQGKNQRLLAARNERLAKTGKRYKRLYRKKVNRDKGLTASRQQLPNEQSSGRIKLMLE